MSAIKQSHTVTVISLDMDDVVKILKGVGAIDRAAKVQNVEVKGSGWGGVTFSITSDIVQTKLDEVEK